MGMIKEKISISECDYDELNSENSRWTVAQFAYWYAKLKTKYPTEGYGMLHPHTQKDGSGRCYIVWEHFDSAD